MARGHTSRSSPLRQVEGSQSPNPNGMVVVDRRIKTMEEIKRPIDFTPPVNPRSNDYLKQYKLPEGRPVRIYCDGIYDLFHYGHARSLEQVKKLFPNVWLIVGVCNDALTNAHKGKTVLNEEERYESLRHCRWVDEVVRDAPWIITQEFIDEHKIDFVAHDDIPYASVGQEDVYAFVKKQHKFIATQRTAGISTSDLITKIVYDYDTYVRRNLSRGVSPKDLNLSFLKESEIKVSDSVKEFRGKIKERFKTEEEDIKHNWESTKDEILVTLLTWESKSHDFVKDFVDLFGIGIFRKGSPSKRAITSTSDNTMDEVSDEGSISDRLGATAQGIKKRLMAAFGARNSDDD